MEEEVKSEDVRKSVIDDIPMWDVNRLRVVAKKFEDEVESLTKKYQFENTQNYKRLANHREDIVLIGNALIKEAVDREWCSEYDDFVDELNKHLHESLPIRTRWYDVEVEFTEIRTQRTVIQVEATSEAAALAEAQELGDDDPDCYINDYDWDRDELRCETLDADEV
jgi:hypothetical protein